MLHTKFQFIWLRGFRGDNGRRMPSDGKSSHCLWQGELKREAILKRTADISSCSLFNSSPCKRWRQKTFKNLFYRVHTICKSKMLFVSSTSSSISSSIFVLTYCGSTLGIIGRSFFISGLSYPHNKHKVFTIFNLMVWVSVRLDGHRGDWNAK